MIHLMLGSAFDVAVRNLMSYVLNYEDKDIADFFTGMLCTREKDGGIVFRTAQKLAPLTSDVPYFNSEPDNPFRVELVDDEKFGEADQHEYLKHYFTGLFNKRIKIGGAHGNVLNVCIYLPLYDRAMWALAKDLVSAISGQNRNINVDLFFLNSDLAYLLTSEEERKNLPSLMLKYEKTSKEILREAVEFKEHSEDAKRLGHVIVMQNCNAEGLSLDLDWDSFVRVIGEFAIATMNSYNDIFVYNAEIEGRPIHTFGLCVLNLDKYYYVKYLLSRAYVTILEREGVGQALVDVNEPSHIVRQALVGDGGRYKFYDNFFEHRVKGYIKDGISAEDVNVKALKDIDNDILDLVISITAFLNDDSLSLPEKRVTLAQLLGMDDELMTGDMFDPSQLLFRDTYADCISMFVRANNNLLEKSPSGLYVDIPESEEDLRKDYPEDFKTYAALSEEQIAFDGILKELKEYEVKIRRQTEYVRTLEKELAEHKIQQRQSIEKNKVLTKDGFTFGDVVYKFTPIETIPLEKTYEPRRGSLPKSVDLRKDFTVIKDQGQVGSCTSFTFASIFEYILGKNGKLDADLSERFLYFTSRVEANRRGGKADEPVEERGTAFIDAIKAMQEFGLCKEDLCRYQETVDINTRPSEEAYADAQLRQVTEAMNVKMNEHDIKSALSEGYPVAVSVRLFSTFASLDHGFLALPDSEEVRQMEEEGIQSNHAMVICGYSDETKVFVVRNSWGMGFGDKGYCYIPYSYITDSHLANQACIVTGTNLISADSIKGRGSQEVVPFDKLNPEINAAIIRVLIGEAQVEKNRLVRLRSELYNIYTTIEKRLISAEVRSDLTKGTAARLNWEVKEIDRQKLENEGCRTRRLEALKRQHIKVNVNFFGSVLILLIIGTILGRSKIYRMILSVIPITKIFFILLAVGIVAMVIWWILYYKRKKEIQEEHNEVNSTLEILSDERKRGNSKNQGNLGLYLESLDIRMFMPWLVVRKLSEQNRILEQKYQVMVNYTENLKHWYDIEIGKIGTMSPDAREPFISLLSNDTLDSYYSSHAEEITQGIKLAELFHDGYNITDEAIVAFQNKLKNRIIKVLEDSLKDFTVYKYLKGETEFEFVKTRKYDIHELLSSLEERAKVFVRMGAAPVTGESMNSTTAILMSYDIYKDQNTWNAEFMKDFSSSLSLRHKCIVSPFKLSFLIMKRIPIAECLDLYDAEVSKPEASTKKKK